MILFLFPPLTLDFVKKSPENQKIKQFWPCLSVNTDYLGTKFSNIQYLCTRLFQYVSVENSSFSEYMSVIFCLIKQTAFSGGVPSLDKWLFIPVCQLKIPKRVHFFPIK